MLITSEADLDAALLAKDPYLGVDGSQEIDLTTAKVIDYPATLHGGRFHVDDGPAFMVTSSDVTLTGVTISGGRDAGAVYSQQQKLVYILGQQNAHVSGVSVRGCTLQDSLGDNIWYQYADDTVISDNRIRRYLYSAVMGISPDRALVSGNHISDAPLDSYQGAPANMYGIAFTDLTNTDADRARHCTAIGNHVSYVDWEALDTHGGDSISFLGNTVLGCPTGVAFVTGNETRLGAPTNLLAQGNIINAAGSRRPPRYGVWLGGLSGKPADGTVGGNQISGYPSAFGMDYVDRAKLLVGGNSVPVVPWKNITLNGDFNANPAYTPRYMVDGNTVSIWGMVVPKNSTRKIIGRLDSTFAWPDKLTFLGESHGSGGGSAGRFQIGVWGSDSTDYPPGTIQAFYADSPWPDAYSYPLSGSFQAV